MRSIKNDYGFALTTEDYEVYDFITWSFVLNGPRIGNISRPDVPEILLENVPARYKDAMRAHVERSVLEWFREHLLDLQNIS